MERARADWTEHGFEGADLVIAMASIVRANQIVEARVDAVLKPYELNMMRFNALSTLAMSRDGRPMGRVAWGLMIHPATVTAVVDRLEKLGLVERHPHPSDRRATLVRITTKGEEVHRRATDDLRAINFGLDGLTPSGARAVTKGLIPLRASAGDIRDTSPLS